MITVSPVESYEFGKHYGKKKGDFLYAGEGMSSASALTGVVRAISDNIVVSSDLINQETVFGWFFPEDCLLLSGGIACKNAVGGSGSIVGGLFTEATVDATWIEEIIPEFPTDVVGAAQLLTEGRPHLVDKGTAVGFSPLVGQTVSQDVEISYYFTYMSDL